ncbi:MAG TPA: hypothetical protein VE133_13975, partial [Candidatus Sulfotelmatobacter sp.]|nr:hypothetical protein [Candidatus Sulfotelmatobacter sp.]
MAHYGKAARLILVIVPVLAMAQAPQMKPAPQPRPAAPGAAAPATATRPAAIPVIARPVVPQALRPAAAVAVPDLHVSQPAQLPPALMVTSANSSVKRDSSAGVDYAFGKLTVVADNAPLGLVLKLVAAKTGAVVDLAPELQNEPVMARLGPDSVRDVLTGLLDSPRIDYIVFGT